jgi:hypothetical protein
VVGVPRTILIGKLGKRDNVFYLLVVSERLVMLCLEKELAGVHKDDQKDFIHAYPPSI